MRHSGSSSEPGPFTDHTCFTPLLDLHRRLQTDSYVLCASLNHCELLPPSRQFCWKSSPVPVPVEASCYNKASHCLKYHFSMYPQSLSHMLLSFKSALHVKSERAFTRCWSHGLATFHQSASLATQTSPFRHCIA